ncbi:tripartite tricarboxylate transporter TctB family protein [Orrella marina]|uniref:DUF1468 domain-containing protein n=1 Tax=Orrella marina TaxID=2163011 RepID=A0A2R4XNJ7_9BURK|nr:tripartite tricarboxylate transporter TctB family protein [Orrella marina]AWB35376.1 hypothetical protein DBV39_18345 [Orrella marina]
MDNKDWLKRMDWWHVIVILVISAAICLYLVDSINASSRVGNLVLILPASILGLGLCLLTLAGIVREAIRGPSEDVKVSTPVAGESDQRGVDSSVDSPDEHSTVFERARPLVMLALFAVYVLMIPYLGMDGSSALFLAAALIVNGERRLIFILGYSIIFAAVATYIFKSILPYPLHTLFI